MMNATQWTLAAIASAVLLAACGRQDAPSVVDEEIGAAQEPAPMTQATTWAEDEHRAALERCEAMVDPDRELCQKQADDALRATQDPAQAEPNLPQPQ